MKTNVQKPADRDFSFDRRKLFLGVSLGALAVSAMAQPAKADQNFTSFAFNATGSTTPRTDPDRWADIFNVKNYGAIGDGVANDTVAINAAVLACANNSFGGGATSGGTVFFPPGIYKVTSSIVFPMTNAPVRLVGSGTGNGIASTVISGTVTGYVVDSPNLAPNFTRINSTSYLGGVTVNWSTGTTVWSCLRPGTSASSAPSISGKVVGDTVVDGSVTWLLMALTPQAAVNFTGAENLSITNNSLTAGDGALRVDNLASGVFIKCRFQGFNAVHASGNLFGTSFIGCEVSSNTNSGTAGTYGAIIGQSNWHGCIMSGFDVGFAHYGADIVIMDGHIENNNTGIWLGMAPTGQNDVSHGPVVMGNSFENNNICVHIQGASAFIIACNNFTGQVAVSHGETTQTGTTTSGSAIVTGLSNTALIQVGNIVTSASGIAANTNVLSIDSGSQVTLTKNATATGSRSIRFQATVTTGISFGNTGATAGKIFANTIGMAASIAGIDMSNADASYLTIENNYFSIAATNGAGVDVIYPTMDKRAGVVFFNNALLSAMSMTFAALPGQAGVTIATPIEGMEYNITDCNTATWGATAAGGGSNHVSVRYNGTNWTVTGK